MLFLPNAFFYLFGKVMMFLKETLLTIPLPGMLLQDVRAKSGNQSEEET
jgi:hypothetical protein